MKKIDRRTLHFSIQIFFMYLGVNMLMSGIHMGFVTMMEDFSLPVWVRVLVPIIYWVVIALCMLKLTNQRIKDSYEKPIKKIAKATQKVANGNFSVYIAPIHSADKYDYFDNMIMDFNKMVKELNSIETLKTDFFSNVSHEIKTPLAVIQNSAEVLKNSNLTQTQYEYADNIYQASKRLSGLISNILRLNRLEKQNILPDKTEYNLCSQLAECAIQFENIWEEKNIEFEAILEECVRVKADKSLVEYVWSNILSNAFKFCHQGGKVILEQKSYTDKIIVSISDNGCGMSEETIKHIFDKFYQGDNSRTTEGNGLGLALAKRICDLMEYDIQVESEIDNGTKFTVIIPIKYD